MVGSTIEECNKGLETLLSLLRSLGFYISWGKIEPPSQITKYLGININTVKMELSLPESKLSKVQDLVGVYCLIMLARVSARFWLWRGY